MSETLTPAEENPTPVENHKCAKCGQLDDHPMVHTWGPWEQRVDEKTILRVEDASFHLDCLPQQFKQLLGDEPQHRVTLAAIEAAKSGVRGDDLRAFIQAQPTDNDVEPTVVEPITEEI